MIVTLAGHVDHGKTSLVKAMTGIDTDRLAEEKQRGLTIDLGFAYIDEGNIGFVDVPGHQKFIHNMVAGVATHQYALLVIAADDGPMPQSREHLDILRLIGIQRGVIALTKTDRVDAARVNACRAEITQLVAGTFLESSQVFATSIEQPHTINELLSHLRAQARNLQIEQDNAGFRLAVDRKFVVNGTGLVVTGTVHSGRVHSAESLHHYPSGKVVRVRGIRAQDQTVDTAGAGDRCALNLSGIDAAEVARGDWISAVPGRAYQEITGELTLLENLPRALKHWTPVHVYHATSHCTGRMALLSERHLEPGQCALVDVLCDTALSLHHGDQLILRDHSLDLTLGGLRVIDANTHQTQRRRRLQRRDRLHQLDAQDPLQALQTLLQTAPVDIEHFRAMRHLSDEQIQSLAKASGALTIQNQWVSRDYWGNLAKSAFTQVKQHLSKQPSSAGLKENEITGLPAELKKTVLNALVQAKQLRNTGGHFQLPEHQAELPAALERTWQRLQPLLNQAQAPSTGDLSKLLAMPQSQLERDLKELTKRGYTVHIANHRFYLPEQLAQIANEVRQLAAHEAFSVKQFRDRTGIGRNIAIEVLEYFDSRGFTRRQGNERIVLKASL